MHSMLIHSNGYSFQTHKYEALYLYKINDKCTFSFIVQITFWYNILIDLWLFQNYIASL